MLQVANYMIDLSNNYTQQPINQVIFLQKTKRISLKLKQKTFLRNIPHTDTRIKTSLLYGATRIITFAGSAKSEIGPLLNSYRN